MRKKLSNQNENRLQVLRCVGMMLVLVPLLIGAVSAATWYVDDDGGAGINFTKIQEAVDAAHDNDTIIVYNGSYNEDIGVYKRLILKGEGHPVVGRIRISTDGCVIDGFNVNGSKDSGIYVYSDYNMIVNNSIYDNRDLGICLSYSNYNTIANNSVSNNSNKGIWLWNSSHNLLTNNVANSNNGEGMDLSHSNNNTITSNTLSNNDGCGIELGDSSNNTVSNNTVSLSDSDGIGLGNSHYNYIINNSIFDNYDEGIELSVSSHNTIINNTVYSNTENGIDVKGSLYNDIANNTVYSNGETGIELSRSWGTEPVVWGSSHNTVTFNVIYLNDDGGMNLKNSFSNIITNNILYGNDDAGIRIKNSSNNQIYNNNLIDNDEQAYDDSNNNTWDNGPIIGGNYWGDHKCVGNPSNCSQPYYIGRDGVDHYPFEDPIGEFELPQLPTTISIDTSHDYMGCQYVSSGSFSSEPTDMTYRMTLEIDARWGQFNVPRIVVYNSTPINLKRMYYKVDDVSKGTGDINVFSDHIEWYGSNELVYSEFELGLYAQNTYIMTPPFSSCRTIHKEVFNDNDTVNITVSVTPAQALGYVEISTFAEETEDASSELVVDTASNLDFIAFADPTEIEWSFEDVIAGETYSTSVPAKVIPKTDSTVRYWLYTKVEAGYGEYADISGGSNQSCIQYIDTRLGTVQIYFDVPVDYTLRTKGKGIFYERYRDYSEDVDDGEPHTVRMWANAYKPGVRTVPVGTTVRWTNTEQLVHTVTSDAGLWDSGTLEEGQHFSYPFNTPGTYTYHDALHPSMRGTVIVQQPSLL